MSNSVAVCTQNITLLDLFYDLYEGDFLSDSQCDAERFIRRIAMMETQHGRVAYAAVSATTRSLLFTNEGAYSITGGLLGAPVSFTSLYHVAH
jgi:hypothetical protein